MQHLTREASLLERHIRNLENTISFQNQQIREAAKEHQETIQHLAQLRLEAKTSRLEQKEDISRLDVELRRIKEEVTSQGRWGHLFLLTHHSTSALCVTLSWLVESLDACNGWLNDMLKLNSNLCPLRQIIWWCHTSVGSLDGDVICLEWRHQWRSEWKRSTKGADHETLQKYEPAFLYP